MFNTINDYKSFYLAVVFVALMWFHNQHLLRCHFNPPCLRRQNKAQLTVSSLGRTALRDPYDDVFHLSAAHRRRISHCWSDCTPRTVMLNKRKNHINQLRMGWLGQHFLFLFYFIFFSPGSERQHEPSGVTRSGMFHLSRLSSAARQTICWSRKKNLCPLLSACRPILSRVRSWHGLVHL